MTVSKSPINKISIPENSRLLTPEFIYGVATASFQLEGGRESRGQNIWDTFYQSTGNIEDHSNGDIACNHFQLWEEDVELIRSLNVDAYRFSISWTRVLNTDGTINHKGIEFYSRLLDRLNEYGIKPFVTLYHWDLPQHLEIKVDGSTGIRLIISEIMPIKSVVYLKIRCTLMPL